MQKRLSGKVAIITGASSGIGRAISVALGHEGATLILAARAIDGLETTASMVCEAGTFH